MATQTDRGIPLSTLSPKFLHSNSTSHTWAFSAIAELIDNAYDPDVNAKHFWIDKTLIEDQDCLIFMDDGAGIDYQKMHKMLSFGFSDKTTINKVQPIGLYGNGFKSGSMRLGKDAIVLSKTGDSMCVGLLSQTYLEQIKAENIVIPIVTFKRNNQNQFQALPEHAACLSEILKYSLFKEEKDLLSELQAIDTPYHASGGTGTRIIIWNLRRRAGQELEFDLDADRYDIRIPADVLENERRNYRQPDRIMQSIPESDYSLRAYCSILYLKPRMQIIIRGQKVKTQLIAKTLAWVRKDCYKPVFLKRGLRIIFGYNTRSKEQYGIMMYHKNRLIKAYKRVGCQIKANNTGVGVIGVIECNFLQPTHNKQDFDDTEEYRKTIANVAIKLEEYWKEMQHNRRTENPNSTLPVEDIQKRPDQNWVQCDSCRKWRKLPDGINTDKLPDRWLCPMNLDPQFRSCQAPEEPEDSDDEQRPYQKTYKQQEKQTKAQQERSIQQQLRKASTMATTSSSPFRCTRSPTNRMPIISDVTSLATTPKRRKRGGRPSWGRTEIKRLRQSNAAHIAVTETPSSSFTTPGTPSTPIDCDDGDDDADYDDDGEDEHEEDDDIIIIEAKSTPKSKQPKDFDISKVKPEPREDGYDMAMETSTAMETNIAEAACPPSSSADQQHIAIQTDKKTVMKEEQENEEKKTAEDERRDIGGERDEEHMSTGDQENRENELERTELRIQGQMDKEESSMNSSDTQKKDFRQTRQNTEAAKEEMTEREVTVKPEPCEDGFEERREGPAGRDYLTVEQQRESRGVTAFCGDGQTGQGLGLSQIALVDLQRQQDSLLQLLETTSQERDDLRKQIHALQQQLEQLQNRDRNKHCHQSTQTDGTEDYRSLYLQMKEEMERLRRERDELVREKTERDVHLQGKRESNRWMGAELNGVVNLMKEDDNTSSSDDLCLQVDCLLRELDQCQSSREDLKAKLGSLEMERNSLLSECECLRKSLHELKEREQETRVAREEGGHGGVVSDQEGSETDTSSPSLLSGLPDCGSSTDAPQKEPNVAREPGQTPDRQVSNVGGGGGPENSPNSTNPDDCASDAQRLRELRYNVARLLLTFVPALELDQVNYDCDVIEEILMQVLDDISAPS
ncbi:MORC family CW-type zinc finger protein 3a [Chanos chanos]|uniref:MORC family CW-type zinc finger protein 3a n=1 Tax=Chanos chanos TaxID=29144 RepID=A0A6J2WFY7_CHACN|nr:MORC family CW-type zinc finger protein 3-like [Chanos chanos]